MAVLLALSAVQLVALGRGYVPVVARERVDVAGLCKTAVENFEPRFKDKEQKLQCEIAESAGIVVGDARRLREAIEQHWGPAPGTLFALDPDHGPHLYGALLWGWFNLLFLGSLFVFDPEETLRAMRDTNMPLVATAHLVWLLLLSFAGAGLWITRSGSEALARLGVARPSRAGVSRALLFGLLWLGGSVALEELVFRHWLPDQYALSKMLETALTAQGDWPVLVGGALVIAVAAGVGEELFFRGLLQPVFGIPATSLLFTLVHSHYGPTYSLLLILAGSLLLGVLRKHYGTVPAMIMHAFFNFWAFLLFAFQNPPG